MLAASFLTAFLSTIQIAQSAPMESHVVSADPYNCGYVRTRTNSSVVAGIFAFGNCKPFYYNETIGDYQNAFAYTLYGGCTCRFYSVSEDCSKNTPAPDFTGPTDRWHESPFAEPMPTWYNCHESI